MNFVCITCGHKSNKLYHEYKGGIIKITLCDNCGGIVDKYVEYDLVIVSLDVLLLKRQAFRHILINSGIQSHWKFCLVLLICEALTKLLNEPTTDHTKPWKSDNVIYSALEIDLYWNFLTATVELFCFVCGVLVCIWTWKYFIATCEDWPSLQECACGLMLSSLGKVLVLPAILWGQNYSILYTRLCYLFTIVANTQAIRVLFPRWNVVTLGVCIVFGHCLAYGVSVTLLSLKSAVT